MSLPAVGLEPDTSCTGAQRLTTRLWRRVELVKALNSFIPILGVFLFC